MAMRTICGCTFEILRYAQDDGGKVLFAASGLCKGSNLCDVLQKILRILSNTLLL